MSEWAYKTCPECRHRVHMNFYCPCGGDPWRIQADLLVQIRMLEDDRKQLEYRIGVIDEKLIVLNKRLPKEKQQP